METPTNITHLSAAILTEILARLPQRSISRFKSVCKTWKSTLESAYFRRLFVSLHKNSSSSWSLMSLGISQELIGFHGCETWDLPKSLSSFIPPSFRYIHTFQNDKFDHVESSNGLVLIQGTRYACYVGNPVLQEWVKIPRPPDDSSLFGLVTRVDEDGVVLSFKVVSFKAYHSDVSDTLSVSLYSSETGIWSSKLIHCPYQIMNPEFMTLNGTLYFPFLSERRVFVGHDFYSESDQFRVVHYPDHSVDNYPEFKRAFTTSGGFVMYIRTLAQKEETAFKAWRLNNDDESWQLLWEIGIPIIGTYTPMAMHPSDSGIVYLWCLQNRHLVSCNLRTRNYRILRDGYNDGHQDCFIGQSVCEQNMDWIWGSRLSDWEYDASIELFQFVLPPWMESVPRPPQVEMINTTSLLSYIAKMQKRRKKKRGDDNCWDC